MTLPEVSYLSSLVTGRVTSLFAADVEANLESLSASIQGRRILAVGGAGSIGRATILAVLKFAPASLHVADINENALADLARDLRNAGMPLSVVRYFETEGCLT